MCTLIALHRCTPGVPLVVAANRDEYLDRPAGNPVLWTGGVVAPRDLRAGGTWLGVNRHGVFAGLTNRRSPAPDPARRSRGLLVLDVLGATGARQAARMLETLPVGAYNPFNLFVADREAAFISTYEDESKVLPLAPGVHVVGNRDPGDRGVPKVARQLDEARRAAEAPPASVLDVLAEVCGGHVGAADPLEETCVHTPAYGTRSSTLLALGPEPVLRFASGPPCTTAYDDFTPLLRELGSPGRDGSDTPRSPR